MRLSLQVANPSFWKIIIISFVRAPWALQQANGSLIQLRLSLVGFECKDYDSRCASWSDDGWCDPERMRSDKTMREDCKETCGVCDFFKGKHCNLINSIQLLSICMYGNDCVTKLPATTTKEASLFLRRIVKNIWSWFAGTNAWHIVICSYWIRSPEHTPFQDASSPQLL